MLSAKNVAQGARIGDAEQCNAVQYTLHEDAQLLRLYKRLPGARDLPCKATMCNSAQVRVACKALQSFVMSCVAISCRTSLCFERCAVRCHAKVSYDLLRCDMLHYEMLCQGTLQLNKLCERKDVQCCQVKC